MRAAETAVAAPHPAQRVAWLQLKRNPSDTLFSSTAISPTRHLRSISYVVSPPNMPPRRLAARIPRIVVASRRCIDHKSFDVFGWVTVELLRGWQGPVASRLGEMAVLDAHRDPDDACSTVTTARTNAAGSSSRVQFHHLHR
jgi:hypothetical protein